MPITGNRQSLKLNSSEHEVVAASARVACRKWINNGSNHPSRQCPFCPPTADLSSCMLKALRDIARLDAGKGCSILGN